MNRAKRRLGLILGFILITLIFTGAALASLSRNAAVVGRQDPPPAPPFQGERFTAVLHDADLNREPVNTAVAAAGWTNILSETFESGIGLGWSSVDNNTSGYTWGAEPFTNPVSGTLSAWAVGGGVSGGALDISSDGYPDDVDAWLVYGPVDMTEYVDASLSFYYWLEIDGGDTLGVSVSTDGINYTGVQTTTSASASWKEVSHELTAYAGREEVYIAFTFSSDGSGNAGNLPGALIDDVGLWVESESLSYLPLVHMEPTPTPSPTPVPTPENYEDKFTDDIDGWEMRRVGDANEYRVEHGSNGFLKLTVEDANNYLIASPLVISHDRPYNIEIVAQHFNPENRDMYGIVIGADWNGDTCPDTSDYSTCFTAYYLLRVEYRDDNGTYLRYKLTKVDDHTAEQPTGDNLIDWQVVTRNIDPEGFNEWDVSLEEDGDIDIFLNDLLIDSVRDANMGSFLEPYFGAFAQTKSNADFQVKFDRFKMTEIK